jgi:hypothetical protein
MTCNSGFYHCANKIFALLGCRLVVTDKSVQSVSPIFNGLAILDRFTLEDWTDRLPRKVCKKIPLYAASHHRRPRISRVR